MSSQPNCVPCITTHRLHNSKRSWGLHPGLSLLKPRMGLFLLTSSEFRCARSKENSVGRATRGNSVSVVSALIPSAWGKGELDSLGAIRGRLKHTSIVLEKALFFLTCKPGVGLKGGKGQALLDGWSKRLPLRHNPHPQWGLESTDSRKFGNRISLVSASPSGKTQA